MSIWFCGRSTPIAGTRLVRADPASRVITALAGCGRRLLGHGLRRVDHGGYFILAAPAIGLDTVPISGFDNAGLDAAFFGHTPNVKSNFISTLGYGDPATIFARSPRPGLRHIQFGHLISVRDARASNRHPTWTESVVLIANVCAGTAQRCAANEQVILK